MNTFDFELVYRLPVDDADPASFVDALAENGCTDAMLGIGRRGYIALMFAREGVSQRAAMDSAMADVQRAIPGSQLVSENPE